MGCTQNFLSADVFLCVQVRRCPKAKPHDWTQCPFAHPTEKAKRRGPTKYKYNGTACADFRKVSTLPSDLARLPSHTPVGLAVAFQRSVFTRGSQRYADDRWFEADEYQTSVV